MFAWYSSDFWRTNCEFHSSTLSSWDTSLSRTRSPWIWCPLWPSGLHSPTVSSLVLQISTINTPTTANHHPHRHRSILQSCSFITLVKLPSALSSTLASIPALQPLRPAQAYPLSHSATVLFNHGFIIKTIPSRVISFTLTRLGMQCFS